MMACSDDIHVSKRCCADAMLMLWPRESVRWWITRQMVTNLLIIKLCIGHINQF